MYSFLAYLIVCAICALVVSGLDHLGVKGDYSELIAYVALSIAISNGIDIDRMKKGK